MLSDELNEYVSYLKSIQSETEDIEVKAAHIDCPKKLYDANDLQKKVTAQCNLMSPKVRPIFTILKMETGMTVVSAEIPEVRQEEKPCYYTGADMQKGSYIRVGDADEPMSSFEIYNLFSYKDRVQDDLRPIERAKFL